MLFVESIDLRLLLDLNLVYDLFLRLLKISFDVQFVLLLFQPVTSS